MKKVKYIFKLKEMKFPEESNSQSRKPVTGDISRSMVLKDKGWRKPSGGEIHRLFHKAKGLERLLSSSR